MKRKLMILSLIITLASCSGNYELGKDALERGNYEDAEKFFMSISTDDKNYSLAQAKIQEIQNIREEYRVEALEKQKRDSLAIIAQENADIENLRNQVNKEIESLKNFDGSKYRGDVSSIQVEIALFGAYALIIDRAEKSNDSETLKNAKILKSKVANLQKTEFPKLRKSYAEYAKKQLWADNINVTIKGNNYTTIEFTGSLFANNGNIKETQKTLRDIIELLRFKRVNYKWYKYDNEYTYYTLTTPSDGDVIKL